MRKSVLIRVACFIVILGCVESRMEIWTSLFRSRDAKYMCPDADLCFTNRTLHNQRLRKQNRTDKCCQGKNFRIMLHVGLDQRIARCSWTASRALHLLSISLVIGNCFVRRNILRYFLKKFNRARVSYCLIV